MKLKYFLLAGSLLLSTKASLATDKASEQIEAASKISELAVQVPEKDRDAFLEYGSVMTALLQDPDAKMIEAELKKGDSGHFQGYRQNPFAALLALDVGASQTDYLCNLANHLNTGTKAFWNQEIYLHTDIDVATLLHPPVVGKILVDVIANAKKKDVPAIINFLWLCRTANSVHRALGTDNPANAIIALETLLIPTNGAQINQISQRYFPKLKARLMTMLRSNSRPNEMGQALNAYMAHDYLKKIAAACVPTQGSTTAQPHENAQTFYDRLLVEPKEDVSLYRGIAKLYRVEKKDEIDRRASDLGLDRRQFIRHMARFMHAQLSQLSDDIDSGDSYDPAVLQTTYRIIMDVTKKSTYSYLEKTFGETFLDRLWSTGDPVFEFQSFLFALRSVAKD